MCFDVKSLGLPCGQYSVSETYLNRVVTECGYYLGKSVKHEFQEREWNHDNWLEEFHGSPREE